MSSSDAPAVGVPAESESSTPKKSVDEADVVIKNPTDGPGTLPFSLTLPLNTTVAELKGELTSKYPGSPPTQAQRLIYAGKLLRDGQKLREILSPLQQPGTPHTIHLVVSSPQQPRSSTQNTSSSDATHSSASNSADGAAPGAQAPRLPQFAYNGHFFGGQVPLPLQEALYAQHLQLVESLLARTLQNGTGTQPDARMLAQMHAADIAAAAAAANTPDGGTQPYAVPPPMPHGNAVFPGMMHMHPHVHVQNMPHINVAAAQQTQAQQMPPQPQQQNAPPQHHAQQPRRFNGFQLDVHIGRHGVQNGVRNAVNAPNQPHVRQFVFQIEINWALMAKLFFLVYLLGHEGNSSRLYTLIVFALGIYLWQTGHLGWLRRLLNTALPSPGRLIENLFPQQPQQPAAEQDASGGSQLARQNPYGYPAVVLSFVYSFLYGFVCSLLPAWHPQPLPRIDQIVRNPERPQEEPNVAANHDHVD
eukprot:TRINITY_DN1901_c0_g1_i1.p1 TRINITY_DN1901_c0_g1~~TRINITY_DN1901_c0_g1_i1.p1  ORF type:complete len:474 (-),score=72.83 TRINITY_DN1901_c0_g1_i1:1611-3032(-)